MREYISLNILHNHWISDGFLIVEPEIEMKLFSSHTKTHTEKNDPLLQLGWVWHPLGNTAW